MVKEFVIISYLFFCATKIYGLKMVNNSLLTILFRYYN